MRGVRCPKCGKSFWVRLRLEKIISCWHCNHVFTIFVNGRAK